MGERGGWPFTIFSPRWRAVLGGRHHRRPQHTAALLPQSLMAIAEAYRSDKAKVETNVTALRAALAKMQARRNPAMASANRP